MDNMGMYQMGVTPPEKKKKFEREVHFYWMQVVWLVGCLAIFLLLAMPFYKVVQWEEKPHSGYEFMLTVAFGELGWGAKVFWLLPVWNFFCTITSIVGVATGIRRYRVQRVFWCIQAPVMFLLSTVSIIKMWNMISDSYISAYVKLGFGPKTIAIIGVVFLVLLLCNLILDIVAYAKKEYYNSSGTGVMYVIGAVAIVVFLFWMYLSFGRPTKEVETSKESKYEFAEEKEDDKKTQKPQSEKEEKEPEKEQESETTVDSEIVVGSDIAAISSVKEMKALVKSESDALIEKAKATYKNANLTKTSDAKGVLDDIAKDTTAYYARILEMKKQGYTLIDHNFTVDHYTECEDELDDYKDVLEDNLDRVKKEIEAILDNVKNENDDYDVSNKYWDAWELVSNGYWDAWGLVSDDYWTLWNKFSDMYWNN